MGLLINIDNQAWNYSDYTVGTLKIMLNQFPDDTLVLIADHESNGYSPWAGDHSQGTYIPDSTWSGEFYNDEDEEEDDETDDELGEGSWADDGVAAIVLYPIN